MKHILIPGYFVTITDLKNTSSTHLNDEYSTVLEIRNNLKWLSEIPKFHAKLYLPGFFL